MTTATTPPECLLQGWVSVSPKLHTEMEPQMDGTWRHGLWKAIRSWMGLGPSQKGPHSPSPPIRTRGKTGRGSRKRPSLGPGSAGSPRTLRKHVLLLAGTASGCSFCYIQQLPWAGLHAQHPCSTLWHEPSNPLSTTWAAGVFSSRFTDEGTEAQTMHGWERWQSEEFWSQGPSSSLMQASVSALFVMILRRFHHKEQSPTYKRG